MSKLEIEFLGTGTSTGVPQLRCSCPVCRSADRRDNRLRASAIVRYKGKNILIDCGPDFRSQMLRATDDNLDCLLITHIHYDHVGGIDDLRAYCANEFPIFARADVVSNLRSRLPYCFAEHPYPGVPRLDVHVIDDNPFTACGVDVEPLPVMHYKLPIYGYRIGPLAYITDAKEIAPSVVERLHGVPLLIINSLRREEHLSHMNLEQTLGVVKQIEPQRAYLTHLSHQMGLHADVSKLLPENVHIAYDGLVITVQD